LTSQDEHAPLFPDAVACQNGTKAAGINKFDVGEIQNKALVALLVQKNEVALQFGRNGAVEVLFVECQHGILILFINSVLHISLICKRIRFVIVISGPLGQCKCKDSITVCKKKMFFRKKAAPARTADFQNGTVFTGLRRAPKAPIAAHSEPYC
jgi:hypothetical protein